VKWNRHTCHSPAILHNISCAGAAGDLCKNVHSCLICKNKQAKKKPQKREQKLGGTEASVERRTGP
jgi:hypothetical protein